MSCIIFDIVNKFRDYSRHQELKLASEIALNNLATVKKLLQQGVNPNVKMVGKAGEPLIFLSFEKVYFTLPSGLREERSLGLNSYTMTAKEECLRLLLEYGANPNIKDSLGRTMLEIAILWCMPNIVKLLLLYDADPNLQNREKITLLMKTVILSIQDARPMQDKLKIIMHLIDSGADIDAQDAKGKTALMYAVGNARIEVVELLVSSGASLSIADCQGNQARDIIGNGVSKEKKAYLEQILTQPQLNIIKYKYQQLIPEGDRLLDLILSKKA